MAYYDALKAQWPSVTGATTADKLAALNALTVAGPRQLVPITSVMEYLRANNLWLRIKAATGVSQGALAAVDYNSDARATSINFDLDIVKAMLADLIANNLFTQAQSDALSSMGNSTVPWWQASGYTAPITYGDLALAGIEGAAWHYQVNSVTGPDNSGASTASVDFWSDADASTKINRQVTSITLTNADIADWAFRVSRDMATRAALAAQITTGAPNVAGA
jgi:hypothetical protein